MSEAGAALHHPQSQSLTCCPVACAISSYIGPELKQCQSRSAVTCVIICFVIRSSLCAPGASAVPAKPTWVSPSDSCEVSAVTNRCPLLQFGFWRVVLDEAQLVAATSSVAAQMTSSLWRRHAWVVTGTPITARLEEIQVTDMQHHSSLNVHPMRYAWVVTCTPITARLGEIQVTDMQHCLPIHVYPMRRARGAIGTPITAHLEKI